MEHTKCVTLASQHFFFFFSLLICLQGKSIGSRFSGSLCFILMATGDKILLKFTQLQLRNVFMGVLRFRKQLHMSNSTIKSLIFLSINISELCEPAVLKSNVHSKCPWLLMLQMSWEMIYQPQTAKLLQKSPQRRK